MSSETRAAVWNLEKETAVLRCAPLTAKLQLARPQLGLDVLNFDNTPLDGSVLSLSPGGGKEWPARVSDAYVRACDLVATYAATSAWPYAPQVYWSVNALQGNAVASLSLLISIQTNLLDTHPQLDVVSKLVAEEVLSIGDVGDGEIRSESLPEGESMVLPGGSASCVLWRLADRPNSYAEIVPAGDFRALSVVVRQGGACESRWELFAEFLEKGVIRRARIHAVFLPREHDVELAAQFCRAAENQPLPLTT